MTLLADGHTHTRFSDGVASPSEMVAAAERAGLVALTLTDHLTLPASMDAPGECSVLERDREAWRSECLDAAEGSRVSVAFGAECDWYPGCEENVTRWAEGCAVRLGSVHWVLDGWIDDPGDRHVWEDNGPDGVWRAYVDAWCRACESSADFDVMAHPDLPFRFRNEGLAPTIDLHPLFSQMAACARDTGRRVEVSTAGLRKSVGDFYPCRPLLEAFGRAGVPVAFGSDAHRPEDVGTDLSRAHAYARTCGYTEQDMFLDGEWVTRPL